MEPLFFPRDLLKLLYWAFFKPFTLERYLKQIDPDFDNSTGLIRLWRQRKTHPEIPQLLRLSLFHILITPWPLGFAVAGLFALAGFEVNWPGLALSVMVGVVFGVVAGVVFGVVAGMVFGVAGGVALGVAWSVRVGVAWSVTDGVVLGVAVGMALGVVFGVALGVAFGVVVGVVFGVVFGVVVGVVVGVAVGVALGVAFGASYWLGHFRLFLYLFEAPYSWLLSRLDRGGGLHLSPVVWDELIWLPLPGLDAHLVAIGKGDRQEGMQAIAQVAGSFRQGWAAQRALLELTAYDVQASNNLEAIAAIQETLAWLPPEAQAAYKSLLLGLETISRHAKAAVESDTAYNREEQLRQALTQTQNMRKGFAYDKNWQVSRVMVPALEVWERVFAKAIAAAQEQENIPNVYVAGRPLDPKSKVFRGRRDVFQKLERELVTPAEVRPALLLFGARRTGKTSVLRQLPETLGPGVIPVEVDLQDAALVEDAFGLFTQIAKKIRGDALQNRRVELPELSLEATQASPYTAFADWLKSVQNEIGESWILLNIDEYEYLEKMLNDGRVGERAFQLLRTLLQNHPRLTLLFSGAHTLDDLNPIWSNYLINVRVIQIGGLREGEARELITEPIPDFPLVYTTNAVQRILDVTACQPYLIQATCRDLVNDMNEKNSFHASVRDVNRALASVLTSAGPYFQELWTSADTDDAQRAILEAIARDKKGLQSNRELNYALQRAGFNKVGSVRKAALRVLVHRDILEKSEDDWKFQVELVRRWVRQEQLGLKR